MQRPVRWGDFDGHDDITLPFAALKISRGKGSGGHNVCKKRLQFLGANDGGLDWELAKKSWTTYL